jgi:hypothetical protein
MPAFRNKLTSLLRSEPYPKPFGSLSSSQKSITATSLNKIISQLSGKDSQQFFNYFCLHSHFGKSLLLNLHQQENSILKRIQIMHTNATNKYKSSLLSLVTGFYSRNDLKKLGFQFSNTQFHTAIKKVQSQIFSLTDYQRYISSSKKSVNQETIILIINYLQFNSRESTVTTNNGLPIYYLEKPKKEIYQLLKIDHPNLKLSLSKFYKLCPKNFKKASKMTDMCPICVNGKNIEKKLQVTNNQELLNEVELYHQHLFFKDQQRNLFNESINSTTNSSCVIILDFKQNFKIGGGPIETNQQFYSKKQISVLGFAIYYKDENNIQQVRYIDFLSEILSHDSLFVINCIKKLFEMTFMSQFKQVCFWSDSGKHFRSAEYMYYILYRLSNFYQIQCFINFFAEYHGKNAVDGHFGILTHWFNEGESVQDILTINDLIGFFRNKANKVSMKVNFDIYSNSEDRNMISRLVINNFQSYMSFTMINNVLFASTLSILDGIHKFTKVSFKIIKVKDKRKTKYAPTTEQQKDDNSSITGPRSKKTLLSRVQLTNPSSGISQHHPAQNNLPSQLLSVQNNPLVVPSSSHDIPSPRRANSWCLPPSLQRIG